MYKSNKKIEKNSFEILKRNLSDYLRDNDYIYAKSLGRKVFLDKLPDSILNRKSTRKKRLQCFLIACDILRNEKNYTQRKNEKNQREFEIKGCSDEDIFVYIHIREESTDKGKNKKLFFVSCYFCEKQKLRPLARGTEFLELFLLMWNYY